MMHAGLPTDVDWRNQDAVAIGKIAQVVSLKLFRFINIPYYTLQRRVPETSNYDATPETGPPSKS